MCLQDLHGCFHRTTAQFKTAHIELAVSLRCYAKLTTQFRTDFDSSLELSYVDSVGLGRIVPPSPPSPLLVGAPRLAPIRTASLASLARGSGWSFPHDRLMNFHEKRCFLLVRSLAARVMVLCPPALYASGVCHHADVQALDHRKVRDVKDALVQPISNKDPRLHSDAFWSNYSLVDAVRLQGVDGRVVNVRGLPTARSPRVTSILEQGCRATTAADLDVSDDSPAHFPILAPPSFKSASNIT